MTADEIIELYDNGMPPKAIADKTKEPQDWVYRVIGAMVAKRKEDRLRSMQAVNRKPQVGMPVEYKGHTYYDYTDLFIDRPCIMSAPVDLQERLRILIGIPCMGSIHAETVGSLVSMLKSKYYIDWDIKYAIYANSLVYVARENILREALNIDADYLLFIDSDIIFPAEAVKRMVNFNQGVVTGIYWRRTESVHLPVIYSDLKPRGLFNHEPKGTTFTGQIEGSERVAGCGMGFCLIRKDVLQKISKRFISPFEPYRGLGEDLAFCYRLKRIKEPIYALNVGLKHIGNKYFDGKENRS